MNRPFLLRFFCPDVKPEGQHGHTDKFNLYVIELGNTGLATEDDKKYGIDTWDRFFKATTWEEISLKQMFQTYIGAAQARHR